MFSQFSLFSQSENYDQSLLILGYKRLREARGIEYREEYKEMNEDGICSADVTNWLLSRICENPKIHETWSTNRRNLSDLATASSQQLKEMDPKKVKELLEFGHAIQKLHEGKPNSRNVENKRFQNDQMSIWLFSLPLMSKNNVVENVLDPFFQQGYVFRFYSKEHVIGGFVDLKERKIFIFDPNARKGEKDFRLGDYKSVYSYLQKRFALIHENLESVSIFLPNTNKHLDLNPIQFQQLKDKIRGSSDNNAHKFFASNSLSLFITELRTFLSKNFQQHIIYLKLLDELASLEKAISSFNNYTIELDDKFIEQLIENLTTIQNLLKIENTSDNDRIQKFVNCISEYLQFFSSFRETFKPNTMSVKLEYLIRNIHIKVSALIKNLKNKPEFKDYIESLQSIIRYANLYGDGSISLENIVTLMSLDIDSLITSHEYFKSVLSWQSAQLNVFKLQWQGLKLKNAALEKLSDSAIIERNCRNNLFAAAESGDYNTVRVLLQTKQYEVESQVNGLSPLHAAILNHDKDTLKLLILGGADVNVQDEEGHTLLHYTDSLSDPEIAGIILKAKFTKESLHKNCKTGNVSLNVIDLLLQRANPIKINNNNNNADSDLQQQEEKQAALEIITTLLQVQLSRDILTQSDETKFLEELFKNRRIDICKEFLSGMYPNRDQEKAGRYKHELSVMFSLATREANDDLVIFLCKYFTAEEIGRNFKEYFPLDSISFVEKVLQHLQGTNKMPKDMSFIVKVFYSNNEKDINLLRLAFKYIPDPNKIIRQNKTLLDYAADAKQPDLIRQFAKPDNPKFSDLLTRAEKPEPFVFKL